MDTTTTKPKRRVRTVLDVFERHAVKIAKRTLGLSDVGAQIMGGQTKDEARARLRRHGIDPGKYE